MELVVDGVSVKYDGREVLSRVSFALGSGQVLCLIGPNGAGKSTLIKAIAGILKPSAGRISIDGQEVSGMSIGEVARAIGYVPQSAPPAYHSSVVDAVLLGRKPYIRWGVAPEDLDIVEQSMRSMGIEGLAGRLIGQLSGGERQKVVIARALAQDPGIFLFDEPTNNLDLRHQLDTLELVRGITGSRGRSALIALHDLNLALAYSDQVVMLSGGRIFAHGPPAEVLIPRNIREVYGVEVSVHDAGEGPYIVPARARVPITSGRRDQS